MLPLLPDPLARLAVASGLDDAAARLGHRPRGVWAPECAVAPGLESVLAAAGVEHLMVDEATLRAGGGSTDRAWAWGDVLVLGRDLQLTDRVWSSRSGFPAGADYRDFHHLDHPSGFRTSRVTDPASPLKAPYDPDAAADQARRDAVTFTAAVRERLSGRAAAGEQPLAVVAWDTELFGHWWHEGPQFLAAVLRMLPEAGVRLATLGQVAAEQRDTAKPVDLPVRLVGAWQGPSAVGGRRGRGPRARRAARSRPGSSTTYAGALPRDRRATRGSTTWPARRCSPCPATGRSWCRATPRPGTRGTGMPGTSRRFHRVADRLPPSTGSGRPGTVSSRTSTPGCCTGQA